MNQSLIEVEDKKLIEARFLKLKLNLLVRHNVWDCTHLFDYVKCMEDRKRKHSINRDLKAGYFKISKRIYNLFLILLLYLFFHVLNFHNWI